MTGGVELAPPTHVDRRRDGHRGAIVGPRWRFLAEASELLDGSLEYQQTLANVVALAVPKIADYSVIALLTEDGSLGWGCSAHRDPAKAELVARLHAYVPDLKTNNHPWAGAVRSGTTQVVKTVDDEYLRSIARDDHHLEVLRALEPTSYIIIPLAARGRILGSLLFATASDSGRRYTDRDVAIAKEVGRRISLALDNAILYRAAEQAARSREETVAVVAHELKNPLATIQMAVSFLKDEIVPVDEAHGLERKQLDVIQRSAERMHRLIHDLLDTAAIEAGHFQLTRSPTTVYELLIDAIELLRPLAAAKRVELCANIPPGLPAVLADRQRVLQVFSNIGGNAIKFTPRLSPVLRQMVACLDENDVAVRDRTAPRDSDRPENRRRLDGGIRMAVSVSVDASEHVRYLVFSAVVTDDDVSEAYRLLAEDTQQPSLDLIVDMSDAERIVAKASALQAGASLRGRDARHDRPGPERIAVIAPTDAIYGIARMYGTHREAQGAKGQYLVFRSRAEAREWLGLPPAESR